MPKYRNNVMEIQVAGDVLKAKEILGLLGYNDIKIFNNVLVIKED